MRGRRRIQAATNVGLARLNLATLASIAARNASSRTCYANSAAFGGTGCSPSILLKYVLLGLFSNGSGLTEDPSEVDP